MKLSFASTALITLAAVANAKVKDVPHHLRRLSEYKRQLDCGNGLKVPFMVLFKSDMYPHETTWWVTEDDTDITFLKGYGYSQQMSERDYEVDVCEGRCYTFHIQDTASDGLCCVYGQGFYKVFLSGQLKKEGGDFKQYEETYTFCVPSGRTPMDPVPFDGWDGKKCLNFQGSSLKEGIDYESKTDVTLRRCMAMACEDEKVTGLDYSEDEKGYWPTSECKLIHVKAEGVKYKDEPGELCYMKKNTKKPYPYT